MPNGLGMVADFAPLFMMGVALFLLGLTVAIAIYDTWWVPRKTREAVAQQDHAQTVPCVRLALACSSIGQDKRAQCVSIRAVDCTSL